MKKMFFLFQAEKMTKVLVLSFMFFFVGVASINAQYLGADDAMSILKTEVQSLNDDYDNSSSLEVKSDLLLKSSYYSAILNDISNGTETGAAIQNNKPFAMPKVDASGWVTIDQNATDFKADVENLVSGVEALLAE